MDTQKNKIHYNSPYYYLGHFSKYIKPGATKIGVASANDELLITAFENPDQTTAVVVMNEKDEAQEFSLKEEGQAVKITIPAHAIQTLVY